MDGKRLEVLPVAAVGALTAARAAELANTGPKAGLVVFDRSSPQARQVLRDAGVAYASASSGEVHLHRPPIHVEWPGRPSQAWGASPARSAAFAVRSSRIPRWLLLHPEIELSFGELSQEVELSEAAVSRTVRALDEDGMVAVTPGPGDARRRLVSLREPGAMLDAFERADASRRSRQATWDIGARDLAEAIERLNRVARWSDLAYTIGGPAGASLVVGTIEPTTVDAWINRDDAHRWVEMLEAVRSRPGPGRVSLRLAPDSFVLTLGSPIGQASVADPVQLYLDCRRAGERALEAADAVRRRMRW
jgi:DNA-binding MarR family transcriptional regulator